MITLLLDRVMAAANVVLADEEFDDSEDEEIGFADVRHEGEDKLEKELAKLKEEEKSEVVSIRQALIFLLLRLFCFIPHVLSFYMLQRR